MTRKFKTNVQIDADLTLTNETASRALQLDGSGNVEASAVTNTELGYLSGVTSAIQTQLDAKATTAYVDSVAEGLKPKAAVRAGTLADITLSGEQTIDTVVLVSGDRILVKNQTDETENGIYVVAAGAWSRSTDFDSLSPIDEINGAYTFIQEGSQAGQGWVQTGAVATIGSDDIIFVHFNSIAGLVGGDGIDITGSTISVDHDGEGLTFVSNQLALELDGATLEKSASGLKLSDTAVTPGTFGSASETVTITVDQQGRLTAASEQNISITASQVSDFNEAAQDAVGGILTDSASIDFTYDDGANTITAAVLPAGVDHDSLQNFVANEHIDHSTVEIATAANTSGLTGGGDITATRNLSVDISGTTAETSADNADLVLIYDDSAAALKSMTRGNFLSGIPQASDGDINETSFSLANNQAAPANVTGFAFANAVVRSFKALVSVEIDATADLFETFELQAIQKGASWDMAVSSVGDDSGIVFTITNAGQIQYTSGNVSGFVSGLIKFRAWTTSF